LNRLPELKAFVKNEGEADSYEGIEINFVRGREAKLSIFDDEGGLIETVSLKELKTLEEMHEMMNAKGFKRTIKKAPLSGLEVDASEL